MVTASSLPSRLAPARVARIRRAGQVMTGPGGRVILAVILLTILEGAVRKWLVGGSPVLRFAAYISKDIVFILGAVAVARFATQTHRRYAALLGLISLLILPGVLVNLDGLSPVGAVLSLRAYLLLPVAAFLLAGSIRSFKRVNQIALAIGILAMAEVLLGSIQFRLPPGHWLNRYDAAVATVGAELGHVRACGTFSYISGMSVMAGFGAWAGIYLFLAGRATMRIVAVAIMVAAVFCGLLAMSRTGVLLALLTIGGGTLFYRRGKELALIGALALLVYMIPGVQSRQENEEAGIYGAAMERFSRADPASNRISYFFTDLVNAFGQYPLGSGLGICQPGGFAATHTSLRGFHVLENEPGKVMQEVGIPGLLGVFLIRLLPVWLVASRWKRCQDAQTLALYSASIPFLLFSAATNVAFNHTLSSAYWCVVALAFAAETISRDGSPHTVPATPAWGVRRLPRPLKPLPVSGRLKPVESPK